MRVAYLQFSPALCNLKETMSRLETLLPSCDKSDLVVLPELCNSGYNFPSKEAAFDNSETVENSIFLSFLQSQCQKYDFDVVTGFNERCKGKTYNSAVLIGKEGYIGRYRKLHLFMNEKDYFYPGDEGLPIFKRKEATLGLLVCYDWFFAEVWKILALKGADIICHPSNLILPKLAQQGIPFHAISNRIFIVTANRIGTENTLTFTGNSLIVDPRGNVLSKASPTQTYVDIVDINIEQARDKSVTTRNHLFGDRRPKDYQEILSSSW